MIRAGKKSSFPPFAACCGSSAPRGLVVDASSTTRLSVSEETFGHKAEKMERMPKRKRDDDDADVCIVCNDEPANTLQEECGHALLCGTCAFRIFSQVSLPLCNRAESLRNVNLLSVNIASPLCVAGAALPILQDVDVPPARRRFVEGRENRLSWPLPDSRRSPHA